MHHTSILLIEDTQAIATQVYDFLENAGFIVDYASTGRQGVEMATISAYDVVVLDLMLPDISGIDVCKQLKQRCDPAPSIIMLTARDSLDDKSEGFTAGADDYLTKPFELVELQLRCQALSKRQHVQQRSEIVIGDLVINTHTKQAFRDTQPLTLSATDFAILMLLVDAYPAAVSRQQVIQKIWGEDFPDSDVLRSHIYTLRKVLDKPFASNMLVTIHGIGFRLQV
ncbi:response regulator transcription factor [Aestuariibacter salexigens]|uniref:response regulator transcription factor n=1 Tax=Aestuariibacter salexigens TaxID=226010 RepID=UPI000424C6CB|nr:response regulator transcription factor [Aestuariibacter salexigens]